MSSARIALPAPKDGKPYKDLTVTYKGQAVNTVSLPHSVAVGRLEGLLGKRSEYAKLYKVNEPWVRRLEKPVLDQHRGLVAAAFTLLDRADPPSSQADFALQSQAAQAVKMAEAGKSYSILYKESLDTGFWEKLKDVELELDARDEEIEDPTSSGASQRIYRLVKASGPDPHCKYHRTNEEGTCKCKLSQCNSSVRSDCLCQRESA